ncbi:unnamed protein product [Oikopleura dioica]|uniref:Uncharacterized protein n=1 Tax=Oikopleura dioica TaxID=34765 RepID=E4XED3_OIKDI|nr:unnamed protein product [Oikopleura dioica]CBY31244.1 unnamed protein product [Oikopleura dioica]
MKLFNYFAFSAYAKKQNEDRLISGRSPLHELTQITDAAISWFEGFYGNEHLITEHWIRKIMRNDTRMRQRFEHCVRRSRSRRETRREFSEAEIKRDEEVYQDVDDIWSRYKDWAVEYLAPICKRQVGVEKIKHRAGFWPKLIQKRLTEFRNRNGVN